MVRLRKGLFKEGLKVDSGLIGVEGSQVEERNCLVKEGVGQLEVGDGQVRVGDCQQKGWWWCGRGREWSGRA